MQVTTRFLEIPAKLQSILSFSSSFQPLTSHHQRHPYNPVVSFLITSCRASQYTEKGEADPDPAQCPILKRETIVKPLQPCKTLRLRLLFQLFAVEKGKRKQRREYPANRSQHSTNASKQAMKTNPITPETEKEIPRPEHTTPEARKEVDGSSEQGPCAICPHAP